MPLRFYISRSLALSALISLLALSISGCGLNTAKFRGENLNEKHYGINVITTEHRDVLAVTSTKHFYSLILPYSDSWDFSWKEGFLLLGNSGSVHVTLSALISQETPSQHLRRLRDTQSAINAIEGLNSAEIVSHRGMDVLVSIVSGTATLDNGNYNNFQHLNLFTARKWKNALYRLHISTPLTDESRLADIRKEFMDYATAGFSVSYMRNVDATDDNLAPDNPWRRGGAKRKK